VAGKDIQDELRAVDDPRVYFLLDVALLRRRKLVIDEYQLGAR
jgi:hypothetical protein